MDRRGILVALGLAGPVLSASGGGAGVHRGNAVTGLPNVAGPFHQCLGVPPGEIGQTISVCPGHFMQGDGVSDCGVDRRPVTLTNEFEIGITEVTNLEYVTLLNYAYRKRYVVVRQVPQLAVYDNRDGSGLRLVDLEDPDCEIQFNALGDSVLCDSVFTLREAPAARSYAYPYGYDPACHPVKEVTWCGAARYCDWLSDSLGLEMAYNDTTWECGPPDSLGRGNPYEASGYRLPTDAEWEYAAQFDNERIYPWGSGTPNCARANFLTVDSCVRWTLPVGSCPLGAQDSVGSDLVPPVPLYDLAGNVGEWVNDEFQCRLGTTPAEDPYCIGEYCDPEKAGPRMLHGGGWGHYAAYLRNASRIGLESGVSESWTGFRIARTVPDSLKICGDR